MAKISIKLKDLKEIGPLIRKRRKELGITQMELGKYCNLSHTGIGKIEMGDSDVKMSTLLKMAKILGLSFSVEMDD